MLKTLKKIYKIKFHKYLTALILNKIIKTLAFKYISVFVIIYIKKIIKKWLKIVKICKI